MGALDLTAAIAKAMEELSVKSIYVVQCETAVTWTGRALAAYVMYEKTGKPQWLLDATEYAHEALEHGALAGPHIYESVFRSLHDAKLSVGLVSPEGL